MLQIHQIPILNDNYVYILHEDAGNVTAVVDPGEADPVIDFLEAQDLTLSFILNTHHHGDHIGGNKKLCDTYGCQVIAPVNETRIPDVDRSVEEGDHVEIGTSIARVIETPGHTLHHIVYYFEQDQALFCGDTLFSIGCGRLFEGSAEQMYHSLSKIKSLPDQTRVYCAHEYTAANIDFAHSVLSDNPDLKIYAEHVKTVRAQDLPTIPSTLEIEKKANPFLLAESVQQFAAYRQAKDQF